MTSSRKVSDGDRFEGIAVTMRPQSKQKHETREFGADVCPWSKPGLYTTSGPGSADVVTLTTLYKIQPGATGPLGALSHGSYV